MTHIRKNADLARKESSLRRKETLVKGEPGETERSYVIQELIDHVMDFTFYLRANGIAYKYFDQRKS